MYRHTQIWRSIAFAIAIFSLLIPTHVSAQSEHTCQPNQVCSFDLAWVYGQCRFNENLFFTRTDRWVIPANGFDYFNFRFGPFTEDGGYKIKGGCMCDVATWINYFLRVNHIETEVDAPYHKKYDIPNVPNTFDRDRQGNRVYRYFVTILHPEQDKPQMLNSLPVKWGYDFRVNNNTSEDLIVRWKIDGGKVFIWLEKPVSLEENN